MKAIDQMVPKELNESDAPTVVYIDYLVGPPYFRDMEAVVCAINLARTAGRVTLLISLRDKLPDTAESASNNVKAVFGLVSNHEREFDFKIRDHKEKHPYWRVIDVTVNHPPTRKRISKRNRKPVANS